MYDIDKDWIPVILALITPTIIGIGWVFKTRREDRLRKELDIKTKELGYLAKIEEQQKTIFAMQQDRISDEANKRKEADVSVSLMKDMTVLSKQILAALAEKDKAE